MTWIPRLYTQRQQEHYKVLKRKNLPSCIHRLFEDAECAAHFMQAFLRYRLENANDSWSRFHVFRKIRTQAACMTPEQYVRYVETGMRLDSKQRINFGSVMLPFSSHEQDLDLVLRQINAILNALMRPDMVIKHQVELSRPLRYLILTAMDTGTWILFSLLLKREDAEAKQTLIRFVRYLGLMGHVPRFVPASSFQFPGSNPSWSVMGPALEELFRPAQEGLSLIPVPDASLHVYRSIHAEVVEEYQWSARKVEKVVDDFVQHENEYRAAMEQMWKQIMTSCRCLRMDGQDVLDIVVPELRQHGYRQVQLYPQLDVCGHVVARFWKEVVPDLEIMIDRDVQPESPLTPFSELQNPFLSNLQKLEKYLVVRGIWKIVTGKAERVARKRAANGNGVEFRIPPRPYYPKLREGAKMTERAKERAEEIKRPLPNPGFTFAKSDLDCPVEVNPRMRPVIELTARDLQL